MSDDIPKMEISLVVKGETHSRSLADDLAVDEEHINNTLIEAPGKTAYWNYLYQAQRSKVKKQTVKVDRYAAEIGKRLREEALADGERVTDKSIADAVLVDEEYIKLQDELLEMSEIENQLKAAVEAIRELRSTLISLSANLRTEGLPTRTKHSEQKPSTNRLAAVLRAKQKEKE